MPRLTIFSEKVYQLYVVLIWVTSEETQKPLLRAIVSEDLPQTLLDVSDGYEEIQVYCGQSDQQILDPEDVSRQIGKKVKAASVVSKSEDDERMKTLIG